MRHDPAPPYRRGASSLPQSFRVSLVSSMLGSVRGLALAVTPFVVIAFAMRRHEAGLAFAFVATLGWLGVVLRSPRRIEILPDRVLVSPWLGRRMELDAGELEVQHTPEEVWLVTPTASVEIAIRSVSDDERDELRRALGAIASEVIDLPARQVGPRRPRR